MVRFSNLSLLKILLENARTPYVKIAEMLNVSEAAIRKRIKKLEKERIILKYTVEVDPKKIGYNIETLIGVDTDPEHYLAVIEKLKNMKEILNLYSSTGDHMMLLKCWFRDSNELSLFIKKIEKIEGVTKICPAIILEKIK